MGAVNPSFEFSPPFALRSSRSASFEKVHAGFDLQCVYRAFEFDEFVLVFWRGAMILEIITIRTPPLIKVKPLSARTWPRVKIKIDVSLPSDADLHRPGQARGRFERRVGNCLFSDPVRHSDVTCDPQHLELSLARIELEVRPMTDLT